MKIQIQNVSEVKNSSSTRTLAHETRKKIVKIVSILSAVAVIAIIAGVLTGCQKEQENEPLDEAILNSSEMEDYVIAGADFHQSLAIFEKKLNEIDFSTLKVTYNAEGKKVIHLPDAFVRSIKIEEKVQTFNEKKEALQKKFPQFSFLKEDMRGKYFQQCANSSVNVCGKFLELGINTSRPKLKNGSPEGTLTNYSGGEDIAYMFYLLSNWASNPNYVEVYIIAYADGNYAIWVDVRNTSLSSHITVFGDGNGNWQYDGRDVSYISHTHGAGSNGPCASTTDKTSYASTPGLDRKIYYQGGFYDYDYCD